MATVIFLHAYFDSVNIICLMTEILCHRIEAISAGMRLQNLTELQ